MVGGLVAMVGTCWWLAECFTTNKVWGWAAILTFPFGNLIWLAFFPRRGWKPAVVSAVGYLLAYGGYCCVAQVVSH
ncbi:MAG TPA: hypothetical protein VGO93_31230 [Candidatus Xenobia bacterium]|jgi:hypothetical protein